MELSFDTPFGLPGPAAYMKLVKKQLSSNRSMLGMRIVGPNLDDWNKLRSLSPIDNATLIILRIAQKLEAYPRLLYGVNCLIQSRLRVECSTTGAEVRHFVLVDDSEAPRYSEIYSFVNHTPFRSTTSVSVQEQMHDDLAWERVIGVFPDVNEDWLACVAQVLQEIINSPSSKLSKSTKLVARTRLRRLAKAGVLPPSSFIHFVEPNIPQFDSMIEYSTSGGFCDAHKITINKVPMCFRVLRQWESSDSGKEVYKQFCRELSVWQQLRHPNILSLVGASTEAFPGRYCFLVPWLSNGPITSFLKSHPEHNKHASICDIADGLNYLHSLTPPVGHKDLKGDNVLVRPDLVCVITDFGLASVLDTQRTTTAGRGTQYWMAPEIGFEDTLDQDCRPRDVYSFGCTIFEIMSGERPSLIWYSIIKGTYPDLPPPKASGCGEGDCQIWDLVRECINIDPTQRPTIQFIRFYLRLILNDERTPLYRIQDLIKQCMQKGYWEEAERILDRIFERSTRNATGSKRQATLQRLTLWLVKTVNNTGAQTVKAHRVLGSVSP